LITPGTAIGETAIEAYAAAAGVTAGQLRADLDRVGSSGTAAGFVTGESGIGKSRLLRVTADAMRGPGWAVLDGRCLDIGGASPFYPVLQALVISERTVGVHIGHIFDKLQVRTRVQASRVFTTAA